MIKGVIFVLLAGGHEMPIPSGRFFIDMNDCHRTATQHLSGILAMTGGRDIRFTCEVVRL